MGTALQQYIELYDEHRELIDSGSSSPLNRLRPMARKVLESARLPRRGDEGFEKTSIEDLFAPDYGINVSRLNLPVDTASSFRCGVPNISTLLAVVAGDAFIPSQSLLRNLPEGVEVMGLAEAGRRFPEIVERYYGSEADMAFAPTALNSLLVQDGVFIRIAKGVRLEKPLQIVNLLNCDAPQLAFRRTLVLAEEDSSADILVCEHSRGGKAQCAVSHVAEIICLAGSRVRLYEIEETDSNISRYNQVYARQKDGSSLTMTEITLLNGLTRNDFNVAVKGEHCETGLYGMAVGSGRQHVDNFTSVVHRKAHCHSDQLFRYILDEASSGAFEGGIEVTPNAPFTEAFQSNGNILASDDARMYAKPQLIINHDEVKCSHGSSTGQLDSRALFYMQTRGIPMEQARTMLMQAYTVDVINTVGLEPLRDRLRHLVEKRFDGTLGACENCLK